MTMRRMVEKIFQCHGRRMRAVHDGGALTVRGFFQAVTGKGQNMARLSVGPLGTEGMGQFVYFGPVEPELEEGDELTVDGKEYILRRCEVIDGTNGPVYRWAICVEKGGVEAWDLSG